MSAADGRLRAARLDTDAPAAPDTDAPAAPPEPKLMSELEYKVAIEQVFLTGSFVEGIELDRVAATAARADSVGAILDPTLYLHGARRLAAVRKLVAAARRFQQEFREFRQHLGETEEAAARSRELLRRARP